MRESLAAVKGREAQRSNRKIHANPRGAKWGALAKFPIIHAWETPKLSGARLAPISPTLARWREKTYDCLISRVPYPPTDSGVNLPTYVIFAIAKKLATYQNIYEQNIQIVVIFVELCLLPTICLRNLFFRLRH